MPHPTRRSVAALIAATVLVAARPASAQAPDAAAARVKRFTDALLEAMRAAAGGARVQARFDRLRPAVEAAFDLGTMLQAAVGPSWAQMPAGQQNELRQAFARFVVATYANRFDGFNGERFEVEPASVEQRGGRLVRTRIVMANGAATAINYLTRNERVVDVFLNGTISELAGRRSEFASIIASSGAGGLVTSLRQRADQLLRG
jgi:phospholipid transport system substrate-binding protein